MSFTGGDSETPFQRNSKRKTSTKNDDDDEDKCLRERRRQLNQQRRDKLKDSLSVMRKVLGLDNRADHLTVMRTANQRLWQQLNCSPDTDSSLSSPASLMSTSPDSPWPGSSMAPQSGMNNLNEDQEGKGNQSFLPDYFQLFLELPNPTVVTGINGKVLGMNRRYSEVTGLQMSDIVGTETLPPWAALYMVHVEKEYQIAREIEILQNSVHDETGTIKSAVQSLLSKAAEAREQLEQLIMWAKANPVQSKWSWFSKILDKYEMLIKGASSAMRYSWTFPSTQLQMKAKCLCSVSVIRNPNTFELNGVVFSYTFLPPATDAQLKEAAACYVLELRGSANLCTFEIVS